MKRQFTWILALSMMGFLTPSAFGQTSTFTRTIGGTKAENSYSIKRTPDGGYITAGYTESAGSGKKDALLIRTDGLGQVLWTKAYGGSGDDAAWEVIVSPDSGYVVAGTSNSNSKGVDNAMVFKTDKTGKLLWTRQFSSDSVEDAYNIINGRGGFFYVSGFVRTDTTGDDAFVAKLSSTGVVSWYSRIGSPGNEESYGLTEDSKGEVVICGITTYDSITNGGLTGNAGNSDMFVAKLKSDGQLRWMQTYGTPLDDVAWDIKADKGNYIVGGWLSLSSNDKDAAVLIIDTTGKLIYQNHYGTFGTERAFHVLVNSNSYSLTGYTDFTGNNRSVFLMNIDAKGALNDIDAYGSLGKDGHWPTEVIRGVDGGYTMLSTSNSHNKDGQDDLYMIKVDDNGSSSCDGAFELFNTSTPNFTSKLFGQSNTTYSSSTLSLTTTNITTIKDSTICCKLVAQISAPTLTVCTGDKVSLGVGNIPGYKYQWTSASGNFTSSMGNPVVNPTATETYKLVVSSSDKACAPDSATVKVTVVSRLNIDKLKDTSFCAGDAALIKTYGGFSSYNWKGRHVSSSDSFITVTESDTIYFTGIDFNSCIYLDTLMSKAFALPVFDLGKDTTICENKSVTLMGPANMKTYNWNNGASNKQSFTTSKEQKHTLRVVDQNGCDGYDELTLLTNPVSTFSLGPDTSFCEGSTYFILGPGALGSYIWNDTSSRLQNLPVTQPGTYHLTAFNSFKCGFSDTITLTHRARPNLNLGSDRNLCLGDAFYLIAPSQMKKYQWQDGSDNDSFYVNGPGSYHVQITDSANCSNKDTLTVTSVNLPQISLGNDTSICDTDSLNLNPGNGFKAYEWSTGSTSTNIWVRSEGVYGVSVTDNNDCVGSASMKLDTIHCNPGSVRQLGFTSFKYFPVPANDHIILLFDAINANDLNISLHDLSGKAIENWKEATYVGKNEISLALPELSAGIYLIEIRNNQSSSSFKILVD